MIFRKFCVSLFLTILISIVSIHVCAQHPRFNPEEIRAKIDSISNNYHIPSIGFGIVSTDSIILSDAVGFANIQLKKRADKKTVYRVGSVTKSFIALGIVSLVEEGLLSLEGIAGGDPARFNTSSGSPA